MIKNRLGEVNVNMHGSKMKIIEYINSKNIIVEFDNKYIVKTRYSDFKKGEVRSPYCKSMFNKGYLGDGIYKCSINQKHTIQYSYWYDMLKRCYSKDYVSRHSSYKNKEVCEEWLNFQNFAKWFDENYYLVAGERMELDKDILNKGNMCYSPEYCVFSPKRINTLFINCKKARGDYPVGVIKNNREGKFIARCSTLNSNKKIYRVTIGRFQDENDAFNAYKSFKEEYIKNVAEEYKDKIPSILYDAMLSYRIDIAD